MDEGADYGFWGEFEHGVDDKGRVVMPMDFREKLGDEFVLTRGPEKAIFVFPLSEWRKIESKLRGPVLNRQQAYLRQMMAGSRTIVKLDPQARLAIPKHLRDWSTISPSQTAVIIGQDNKLEIWAKAAWDAKVSTFTYDSLYEAAEAVGLATEFAAG